jgi:hypothetical protein
MDRSSDLAAELAEIAIPSISSGASASVAAPSPAAVESDDPDAVDPYDYGDDATPDAAAVAKAFADLDRMTLAAERLIEQHKKAEEYAQKLKASVDQLLTKDIPEHLARMRLDDCTTSSGIFVKVKREIKASLPGHERIEARMGALRWLVEHGHGGVIKNNVTVTLERGADERADALVVDLRAKGFDVESKKDVHASTLSALVRELMTEGKVIPPGTFNTFDMRLVKLTRK